MKKRSSIFCVTLASLTFTTLLLGARSEPADTVSGNGANNPTQPAAATEPSPKTNGIKTAAQPARLITRMAAKTTVLTIQVLPNRSAM